MNTFENKTLLITGATGLLGSHFAKKLLTYEGCTVVALGRNINKLQDVFNAYKDNESLKLLEGDVSDSVPEYLDGFDYIFHAASPIAGDIIRNHPVSVIKPNILGTINCLEYLKKRKDAGKDGNMVVFSSATVYSNLSEDDYRMSESETAIADTLDAPNAPYSESKRMAEVIARSYARQYGLNVLIARFSYLYGYSKQAPNTAFYEFIGKSLEGEKLTLNSNGAPRRDNIFVDDAVNGLISLCDRGIAGESYNISSGGDKGNFAAIDEIAYAIANCANSLNKDLDISVNFRENVGNRKPGIILDNSKLKALGWNIEYSLEEGIRKTLQSYM